MTVRTADKLPDNGKQNDDYHDPIAKEVGRRLREGQNWRQIDSIGGRSVERVLTDSYNQYHSILPACDQQLVDESGIDVYVSITQKKCRTLEAFMRDLIMGDTQQLLNLRHTPIPELSKAGTQSVVAQLREALAQVQGTLTPDTITQLVQQMKGQQLQQELIIAQREASRQEKVIADQWTETGFIDQYSKFIHYLGIDPYAVMVGPITRGQAVMSWSGNSLKEVYKQNDYVHAPDPRDYFYSEDACGRGTGKFEMVREKMSKSALRRNADSEGWIKENVLRAIERHQRNAMLSTQNGGREQTTVGMQTDPDMMPTLRHFGKFSGCELRPYGLALDDDMQYECMALVIGGYTCRLEVNVDPTAQQRRIYTTSYQEIPGRIAGFGIAQLARDIERMFMSALRNLMQNVSASAMPMGEVDYTRIARYMAPESIGAVMANTIMPVDPDLVGGGRPAHHFHNIPSQAAALTSLVQFFDQMADEYTGLPAALHGQPIGTGANRTFRGMINLQGNAMKIIQSAFFNIDRDIFNPLIQTYHYVNSSKHKFRGDAKVEGSGVGGLLQKELARQRASENVQVVAQLAASAPNITPSGAVEHATTELLRNLDMPDHVLNTPPLQSPDQQLPPQV